MAVLSPMAEFPKLLGKADVRRRRKMAPGKGFCTKDANGLKVTPAGKDANVNNATSLTVEFLPAA